LDKFKADRKTAESLETYTERVGFEPTVPFGTLDFKSRRSRAASHAGNGIERRGLENGQFLDRYFPRNQVKSAVYSFATFDPFPEA
jgi:hypothetical protein